MVGSDTELDASVLDTGAPRFPSKQILNQIRSVYYSITADSKAACLTGYIDPPIHIGSAHYQPGH